MNNLPMLTGLRAEEFGDDPPTFSEYRFIAFHSNWGAAEQVNPQLLMVVVKVMREVVSPPFPYADSLAV